jgi:hypothetical protein
MMVARFVGNIVLALVAIFLIVASLVFSSAVTGWLMFGVALGVVALVGLAQLDRHVGVAGHVVDGLTGTLAIWATIASVVFAGTTVTWLSFAEAIGFVALAAAGTASAVYGLVRQSAARRLGVASFERGRPAEVRPAA